VDLFAKPGGLNLLNIAETRSLKLVVDGENWDNWLLVVEFLGEFG
jgi:hypothetical protein